MKDWLEWEFCPKEKNCLVVSILGWFKDIRIGLSLCLDGSFHLTIMMIFITISIWWKDMSDDEMIKAITPYQRTDI